MLFLRICTMFCMSEAETISNGSRILPCPLGPYNALKTKIYFGTPQNLLYYFWEPLRLSFFGATVGPCQLTWRAHGYIAPVALVLLGALDRLPNAWRWHARRRLRRQHSCRPQRSQRVRFPRSGLMSHDLRLLSHGIRPRVFLADF